MAGFAASGSGSAPAAEDPPVVTAFPGYFIAGGGRIDSLDPIAAWAESRKPAVIRIEACGEAATRSLLAVVWRLRRYPLQLGARRTDDAECGGAASSNWLVPSAWPGEGDPDGAIERYWQRVLP